MMEWIVTSSALILIVIALRGLLKGKISLKLQYGLWALVLIRLLIPFSIVDSALSVVNILEGFRSQPVIQKADDAVADYESAYQNVVQRYESSGTDYSDLNIRQEVQQELFDRTYEKIEYEYAQAGTVVPEVQIQTEAQQQVEVISLTAVITEAIPYLWIGGMVILAVVLIGSNLHFAWKLYKSRNALDIPSVPLNVYLTDYVATPCLFGVGQSDIYLTQEVMTDSKMRSHVLAHEMSHYRQGDHIWSVLRCLCLVLHWYNPLVWVAAVLSKQDAELACDEATIHVLGENERVAYGRTLIGMTCIRRDPNSLMLAATTMLGTKKTLKDRIALIAKKPKTALYTLIACILVAAIAVGCTFTGASSKSNEELLLDRCREAVEYIQNLEHFEITEHYEVIEESDYVLGPNTQEARYIHSGDDWYHFQSYVDWTWQFLEKDGKQYRKDITKAVPEEDIPALDWRPEDLSTNLNAMHAWIMDVHWNDETIEFLTYTGNGDGYEGGSLTPVSVTSDTDGDADLIRVEFELGAERSVTATDTEGVIWIFTFRFDRKTGTVTEVKREIIIEDREIHVAGINGGTEYVDFRSTSTLTISPGTEEEMSAIIDDIFMYEIMTTVPGPEASDDEQVINWDIPNYPQLSYEDYFSKTRYYYYAGAGENWAQLYYWGGWYNGKDKCNVWTSEGKIFAGDSLEGSYVQVGDETYDDIQIICCDELWIYAIEDQTELFRIDYNGENRQTLYADEIQKILPRTKSYAHVRDGCVLFFVTEAGSVYNIYRLYLPDMTLDLLYTTQDMPFLYEPYSNFEITWSCPVKEVVDDVYEIDYYYNCLTGELLERPVHGDRSWGNTTWAWWDDQTADQNTEIAKFQDLLTYENGYWYWRAMGCVFEKPEDISLYYLFYNGLPSDEKQDPNTYTQSEVAFLKDLARNSTWRDESVWVNAHKMPRQYISDVLAEYFGLTLNDVTIPEEWSYFAETDSYYYIRSDGYGVTGHTVTEVVTGDNGLVYVYWTTNRPIRDTRCEELVYLENPQMVTVLREMEDGSYLILMNTVLETESSVGLLSDQELKEFEDLLIWNGMAQETEETMWYSFAIKSVYEHPAQIDLLKLFESSVRQELTQADRDFLTSIGENPDQPSMVHKYSIEMMDAVLKRYFGISFRECEGVGLDKMIYNAEGGCYYHRHGDFSAGHGSVTGGERLSDGTVLIHYLNPIVGYRNAVEMTITLVPTEEGFQIVSNVLSNPESADLTPIISHIRDRSAEENLSTDSAPELFYADEENRYYFPSSRSQYITVFYSDGSSENIVTALKAGRATIVDLDKYVISYYVESIDPAAYITNIRDRAKEENLPTDQALELFFMDTSYRYYFPSIRSQYIIVTYSDGSTEDIITALQTERATIADLDTFGIHYIIEPRE